MSLSSHWIAFLTTVLSAATSSAGALRVDFTPTGGSVAQGYQGYFATQEVISSFTPQSFDAFGASITLTPSWRVGAPTTTAQLYDRGGSRTDAPALLRDWIGTDARLVGDPLTLTIEGLPAGTYRWLSRHHDSEDQTGTFQVTIQDALGITVFDNQDISHGALNLVEAGRFNAELVTDGSPVQLSFNNTSAPSSNVSLVFFVMNSFELFDASQVAVINPLDGAASETLPSSLEWLPPATLEPTGYRVYIGTNPDVRNNPVLHTTITRLTPELEPFETYYWAVDTLEGETVQAGPTWSFTTSNRASAQDQVDGNLILFDPNGAWTWYSDERAIVDPINQRVVAGSLANADGPGGAPYDGDVRATLFDLATGARETTVLREDLTSYGGGDDHNAPAFVTMPSGDTLAFYAGHNNNDFSYYRTYDESTRTWGAENTFNWNGRGTGGSNFETTYSNLYRLSAEGGTEGRLYLIARADERSPNFIYSDDAGVTWNYGGQLTSSANVGYVNGYFKYWSNGIDRIDFIATEHHPRDFNTSLYHGYIQNGRLHNTLGEVQDENIFDKANLSSPNDYTPVFLANTVVNGITMTKVWNTDLMRYPDGSIAALFKARANNSEQDHRTFYARFDGEAWTYAYLGKAGPKLYDREQDYTGLGALDPDDPTRLYLSTPFDPSSEQALDHHEIFEGHTDDDGATWQWRALTWNSSTDNLRPVVPQWDSDNTALLWFRGEYRTAQAYDTAIVGLLEGPSRQTGPVTFVNATLGNTTLADGSPLVPSGPGSEAGSTDGNWHLREGFGNEGTIFTADDTSAEEAPALRSSISIPEAGTYDVYVFFWSHPTEDWRIRASLPDHEPVLFRRISSQSPASTSFESPTIVQDGDLALYRGYVGRVTLEAGDDLQVVIDDADGSAKSRVAYDGWGYARVEGPSMVSPPLSVSLEDGALALTVPSLIGYRYQLQRITSLIKNGDDWSPVGLFREGTGTPEAPEDLSWVESIGNGPSRVFYRVIVQPLN